MDTMIHGILSVIGHIYCLFKDVDTAMWTQTTESTSDDVKVTSVPSCYQRLQQCTGPSRGCGAQCTGQAAVAEPSVQAKPRWRSPVYRPSRGVAEPCVPAQAAVAEPSVQAKPRWRSPVYRPSRGGGAQCTGHAWL